MNFDAHTLSLLFELIGALCVGAGTWFLTRQKATDAKTMADRAFDSITEFKLTVAREYVDKRTHEAAVGQTNKKLDGIDAKLDKLFDRFFSRPRID